MLTLSEETTVERSSAPGILTGVVLVEMGLYETAENIVQNYLILTWKNLFSECSAGFEVHPTKRCPSM